tara:strand:- start:183 stop:386 length:204 start_codon:yes stop_codon:yes gene_type:complete
MINPFNGRNTISTKNSNPNKITIGVIKFSEIILWKKIKIKIKPIKNIQRSFAKELIGFSVINLAQEY